jgi:hypothetical protein
MASVSSVSTKVFISRLLAKVRGRFWNRVTEGKGTAMIRRKGLIKSREQSRAKNCKIKREKQKHVSNCKHPFASPHRLGTWLLSPSGIHMSKMIDTVVNANESVRSIANTDITELLYDGHIRIEVAHTNGNICRLSNLNIILDPFI